GCVGAVGPRGSVLRLFLPHAREIVLQHVHPTLGVVIEKAIQSDLNVDGNDFVASHGRRRRASRTGAYRFMPLVAGEREPFRCLVAGGLSTSRRGGSAPGWTERRGDEREGGAGGEPRRRPRPI